MFSEANGLQVLILGSHDLLPIYLLNLQNLLHFHVSTDSPLVSAMQNDCSSHACYLESPLLHDCHQQSSVKGSSEAMKTV